MEDPTAPPKERRAFPVSVIPRPYGEGMNTNAIDSALALLEGLAAEVVDMCADAACEICHPALRLAA